MKNKLLTALLSVVVAVGIWLYVVTVISPNSDKHYYNIAVEMDEAPLRNRGLMITDTDNTTASLHLEGSRVDLNKLSSSNITLTADVSKIYEPGIYELTYTVTFPGDVASNAITILSKNPSTVIVEVQERITKDVPIEIVYSGSLADPVNLMADKENAQLTTDSAEQVESVSVTGPKSVVDQITVATIAVDLEGRSETISGEQYTYTLCNSNGEPVDAKMVTTDVASVNLTLQIMRVKEIQLTVNVIEGGGATLQNSNITISPRTIWVSGSDALLEDLESLEIGTINLGEILEDETRSFVIKLPEGVTDETGVVEATVEISFPNLTTKSLTITDFEAVNVPAGLSVEMMTKALEIQFRGPAEKIEKLEASNVTVTVDFTDAQVGPEKIKVTITCSDPEIGAVGSYTVSATLSESEEE